MEITKDNWIDQAMRLQGKKMAQTKIPKGVLTRFQVTDKFEGTSKSGKPYFGLKGDRLADTVFCYNDNYDVAHKVNVGDMCECYVDGSFANNLVKLDEYDPFADDAGTPATQAMHDATRRLVPPSPPATANFLGDKDKSIVAQNLINRATEIYIHEAPPKFDPARLTEIATDVVGVYKEVVKQL